eukprot:UN1997
MAFAQGFPVGRGQHDFQVCHIRGASAHHFMHRTAEDGALEATLKRNNAPRDPQTLPQTKPSDCYTLEHLSPRS